MLKLGEDYYVENGDIILTTTRLMKRGRCCHMRCRHCPYGTYGIPVVSDEYQDQLPTPVTKKTK